MQAGDHHSAAPRSLQMIAGIQSGVLGGVFVLVWLGLISTLQGRSAWTMPNLLATTFYGRDALRAGFRWSTLSGVALQVILSAAVGMLFGLVVSGALSRQRVMLLGLAVGVGWYFLALDIFWRHVNPMVPLYASGSGLFVGHLGLGVFLGSFPRYLHGLVTPTV